MKYPNLISANALWPTNRLGVLQIAEQWYDPARVKINNDTIGGMAVGEVQPPPVGDTNLERPIGENTMSEAAQYAIAMNAINYMFWAVDDQQNFVRYARNGKVGALAMTDAFQNAWDDPNSALNNARMRGVPLAVDDITGLFGDIPDPQSRADILNEVLLSPRLAELGTRMHDVHTSNGDFSTSLASALADAFPKAYGDELLKKAQLAISGVWREAMARNFSGSCVLTAFADYQIPNVLRALGILEYDEALAKRIDGGELIGENSPEERAIRAAAVLAVEKIAQHQNVDVADVDYWVWLRRREPKTPFHLTVTTTY